MQQQNTPITQVSFGEDDSSCDSHTRWGKLEISMNEKKIAGFEPIISDGPAQKEISFVFYLCYLYCFLAVMRYGRGERGVITLFSDL